MSTILKNNRFDLAYGFKRLGKLRDLVSDSLVNMYFDNNPIIDPEAIDLLSSDVDKEKLEKALQILRDRKGGVKETTVELSDRTITLSLD